MKNQIIIFLIAASVLVATGVYVYSAKNSTSYVVASPSPMSQESTPTSEPSVSEQTISLTWKTEIDPEKTEQEKDAVPDPYYKLTLILNGAVKKEVPLGSYVSTSPTFDGTLEYPGAITTLRNWYAGGGYDFIVLRESPTKLAVWRQITWEGLREDTSSEEDFEKLHTIAIPWDSSFTTP